MFCFIAVSILFYTLTLVTSFADILDFRMCYMLMMLTVFILPIILENALYFIGVISKQIVIVKLTNSTRYEPNSKTEIPYTVNFQDGIERYSFFIDEGETMTATKQNVDIKYGQPDNIIDEQIAKASCRGLFKILYGEGITLYKYTVSTTIVLRETNLKIKTTDKDSAPPQCNISTLSHSRNTYKKNDV